MYRLGHQIRHRYRWYIVTLLLVIVLAIIGIIIFRHGLKTDTSLSQSKVITQYYSATGTDTMHVTAPTFSVYLPAGWKTASNAGSTYKAYSWQGTGDDVDRRIDIYIDNLPTNLAVNRLLPVQVNDDQLEVIGSVSDNCTGFTTPTTQSATSGTVAAKWDGVNFICDVANYERDVVAIGSTEGVNTVTMVGPSTGSHNILLVYTDNSADPDYSIFTSIVESFQIL
jgi:hypothetical protein